MISIYAMILVVFLVAILVLLCIRDYLRYGNLEVVLIITPICFVSLFCCLYLNNPKSSYEELIVENKVVVIDGFNHVKTNKGFYRMSKYFKQNEFDKVINKKLLYQIQNDDTIIWVINGDVDLNR